MASISLSGSIAPSARIRFGARKNFTRTLRLRSTFGSRFVGRIFGRPGMARVVAIKAGEAVVRILRG